jgi:oxygen-dependent protoporphyrinogen oxidase
MSDERSGEGAPRVCVIGAGISGLTTAYRLKESAKKAGRKLDVTVLEATERAGGIIETLRTDGFVMERGPDSIITEKPQAAALCREIGLGSRVIPTGKAGGGSLIVRDGQLHPIPEGLHLMAPSKLRPFAMSKLVSWPGKLRMAADLLIPAKNDGEDESLAAFVRRRLGREALERIAQPMVGGIYTADPERLSLAATMPRFIELERKYGSVIRGLAAAGRSREQAAVGRARGPRYDLFVSLDKGLEVLPERLVERIGQDSIRFGFAVDRIEQTQKGWRAANKHQAFEADAVCLATPAARTAAMLKAQTPEISADLAGIESTSAATLNLAYRRQDIGGPLDAFGFVVPAVENTTILACTFCSVKYAGRAPGDFVLLRTFVGGALSPQSFDLDDEELMARAEADLARLLDVRGKPVRRELARWPASMPQYHVGHIARIDRIEAAARRHPGLELAGNAYRGTGIPDCVRSGEEAAARIEEFLFTENPATAAGKRPS